MAEPLKHFFDRALVRRLSAMLRAAWPAFPERRFVDAAARGLDDLDLLARARHVMEAMAAALPADYPRAVEILVASLGPELDRTEGSGMGPFLYMPHGMFVAERGLDHFEPSMRAQYEITKRFTAEFSIRPFLARYPEETLARLRVWASDPNVHVRRLVSEGTRPRLPWAQRLRAFQRDPGPVVALLELLKDDPEQYVRRSVANNLNDIGKDHPDVLLDVCRRWSESARAERRWIVRHALRSAVKRGDPGALALLGYGVGADVRIEASIRPRRVRVGGEVKLSLVLSNPSQRAQRVNVDLVVHFVKKAGATRPKVFKIRALELGPGERATLDKTISFAQRTTRTHYAGRHPIDVLLNGAPIRVGEVVVVDA